jgi:peptidoglycan/xylan/chitin deacetylase (PgdA/CDA1 family)
MTNKNYRPLGVLLPVLLLLLLSAAGHAAVISDYRVIRTVVSDEKGAQRVAIRRFLSDNVEELLVVDPVTLQSSVHPACKLKLGKESQPLLKTPYLKSLGRYGKGPYPLQNSGAIHSEGEVDGVFLTVDLCPSKRPFERELFDAAAALATTAPVPVAVAVTGRWLAQHPEEIDYLKQQVAAGKLAITWVNHSDRHHYDPAIPLEKNFLLAPGTDMRAEVLNVEQQLLAQGLVPSPFFRFPGLVSDQATMTAVNELSLIPLGSDAWLAKGEAPRKGSFILVHGNGNEPKGVKLLLPILRSKEFRLLPLPAAFAGTTR